MTSETSNIFNSPNMQMGMLDEHVEAQLFTTHIGDYTAAGRDADPTAANNGADNTKKEVDKEEEEEEQRRIDKELELNRPITIIVRHDDAEGELTYFKIRKGAKIIKLFLKFSERESIPLSSLCFFLNNGRRVNSYDIESTVLTYGLEEEDIIDVRLRTETEKQPQQIISEFMSFMKFPPEINVNDGMNLVQLLYEIGKIPEWIATFDRGRTDCKYGFSEYCFDSGFDRDITIDRETGRITHLALGVLGIPAFSLPSIIGRFKGLSYIYLVNCCLLHMELGNLPLLESIEFCVCPPDMFENIPEGLRLPSSIKKTKIKQSEFGSFLSPFLQIFPNTLEELSCRNLYEDESDGILHSLQNDDLSFRQNLKTIKMNNCGLDESDLERLMWSIRPLFSDLHTLDVSSNNIESLRPIEHKINQIQRDILQPGALISSELFFSSNLRELSLSYNPIAKHISHDVLNEETCLEEKKAFVTFLETFKSITNLGLPVCDKYDPEIEYVLRINQANAGRKFILKEQEGESIIDNNVVAINRTLWPKIFERSHNYSASIYDTRNVDVELLKRRKSSTGLFYLVRRYVPLLFAGGGSQYDNGDSINASTSTACTTTDMYRGDENEDGSGFKNPNRKRKRKREVLVLFGPSLRSTTLCRRRK